MQMDAHIAEFVVVVCMNFSMVVVSSDATASKHQIKIPFE